LPDLATTLVAHAERVRLFAGRTGRAAAATNKARCVQLVVFRHRLGGKGEYIAALLAAVAAASTSHLSAFPRCLTSSASSSAVASHSPRLSSSPPDRRQGASAANTTTSPPSLPSPPHSEWASRSAGTLRDRTQRRKTCCAPTLPDSARPSAGARERHAHRGRKVASIRTFSSPPHARRLVHTRPLVPHSPARAWPRHRCPKSRGLLTTATTIREIHRVSIARMPASANSRLVSVGICALRWRTSALCPP
jgi:hypothetical protein